MKTDRIVGFLDVLGFSALVSRQDFDAVFQEYINSIRRIIETVDPKIIHTVFSDSIVFLPSKEDEAFVASLMKPVHEPGKIANWIAPPQSGVKGKPFDFEYVRRA